MKDKNENFNIIFFGCAFTITNFNNFFLFQIKRTIKIPKT